MSAYCILHRRAFAAVVAIAAVVAFVRLAAAFIGSPKLVVQCSKNASGRFTIHRFDANVD